MAWRDAPSLGAEALRLIACLLNIKLCLCLSKSRVLLEVVELGLSLHGRCSILCMFKLGNHGIKVWICHITLMRLIELLLYLELSIAAWELGLLRLRCCTVCKLHCLTCFNIYVQLFQKLVSWHWLWSRFLILVPKLNYLNSAIELKCTLLLLLLLWTEAKGLVNETMLFSYMLSNTLLSSWRYRWHARIVREWIVHDGVHLVQRL